jgi:hypothetical protein
MRRLAPIAFLSLMSLCASSQAALGSAPSSFSGKTALKARSLAAATSAGGGSTGGSAVAAAYTVNETTLDGGTVVREYVGSSDGNVFAVSWNGPFMPDLRTLLGSHFATLTSAAAARPKAGHSQLSVKDGDVVIVSGGHMRAYAGRAWIVSALPAGVSADEIE